MSVCCAAVGAGIAALGRGGAAMPAHAAGGMGPKQSLMQLASEAVRVAAQSPFLENAVGRARAVLCCLYLPHVHQSPPGQRSSTLHRQTHSTAHAARSIQPEASFCVKRVCQEDWSGVAEPCSSE